MSGQARVYLVYLDRPVSRSVYYGKAGKQVFHRHDARRLGVRRRKACDLASVPIPEVRPGGMASHEWSVLLCSGPRQ